MLALAFAMSASAASIGPDCGTCAGSIYALSYATVSTAGPTNTYDIFLDVDTSGYDGGGDYLFAVAPKVSSDFMSVLLLTAPMSHPAGSTWTTTSGGINADGCSDAGSGFWCTSSTGHGVPVPTDSLLNFSWRVVLDDSDPLFTGTDQASIKALYTDMSGNKVGPILSEAITLTPNNPNPVPEPGTWFMLATGGGFLLLAKTRRFRQRGN